MNREIDVVLTRDDLYLKSIDKSIDELEIQDFEVPYRRIMDADTVVFLDDETLHIKALKSRYYIV
jgi:hypothetical protein